jgi:DNA-binding transcriptional MerR regulator
MTATPTDPARPADKAAQRYSITDLSDELEITPRTIRFWEDQGLIAPGREGGKRVYTRRDRTRLKLALRGKRLGLSLAEIKDLINMYDAADRDDRQQLLTLLGVLARRRVALQQQLEDIEAVLGELERFETVCKEALGAEETAAGLKSATSS